MDACPSELKPYLASLSNKFKAFHISFNEAKLNHEEICFFDTLPKKFLKNWCEIKNEICVSTLHQPKPQNYEFQKRLSFLIEDIKSRSLNIDWSMLSKTSKKTPSLLKVRKDNKTKICYNQYGTVTGRLSTTPTSFPILTMDKINRSIIRPQNDLFLELDFNAAELRTLLALTNKEQPAVDIHNWINLEIYKQKYTREQVKQKVFAWLYNSNAKNKRLNELFQRDIILDDYYIDGQIETPFHRKIMVEERKAVNYLIQSTTSDIVLRQAIKLDDILKQTKSFIAFIMHDSIIVDISQEQKSLLPTLINKFADTDLGQFKINVSLGKNYGAMKRIEWQQ